MATQDSHKELFLDMLTKEEKEALLTKKMENLRKQNAAIQKRYEEVEADKKKAEVKIKLPGAQKEATTVPRAQPHPEDHDPRKPRQLLQQQQQPQQQSHQGQSTASRPATRSKPPSSQGAPGGKGQRERERPKSQDFRSEPAYEYEPIVDITDLDNRHSKRALSPSKARRNAPRENASIVSNRYPAAGGKAEFNNGSGGNRSRDQPLGRSHGSGEPRVDHLGKSESGSGRPGRRGGASSRVYTQTFSSRRQTQGRVSPEDGPPPDPAYNYLSDRARDSPSSNSRHGDKMSGHEGGGGGRGGKDPRRHPRNFGGADFGNVKPQMKAAKEKERDRRSFPPRNRLEMTVNMTGAERFQYEEWKAERHRVDQERLDRQKTSGGEWRRAWDQEKLYEESLPPGRTEPARRPVGRIGSGRFDRGDRDDRRPEGPSPSPKASNAAPSTQPVENERKPPAGQGRGRGRGRGRARTPQSGSGVAPGSGEKPPRPRTWSGGDDSRTVECANDMLVVKIDKSRTSHDNSVEVEYGPDDEAEKKRGSGTKKKPGRRSPTKQQKQPSQHQFQDADVPSGKMAPSSLVLPSMSSQDSSGNYEGRPASLSQSISIGSTDEWEDVTGTDSDLYATTTEDEAESQRRIAAAGRLNPEAPAFQPTSPDLSVSPPLPSSLSPRPGFDPLPKQQRRSGRSSSSASASVSSCSSAKSDSTRESECRDVTAAPDHDSTVSREADPHSVIAPDSGSVSNGRAECELLPEDEAGDEVEETTPDRENLHDGKEEEEEETHPDSFDEEEDEFLEPDQFLDDEEEEEREGRAASLGADQETTEVDGPEETADPVSSPSPAVNHPVAIAAEPEDDGSEAQAQGTDEGERVNGGEEEKANSGEEGERVSGGEEEKANSGEEDTGNFGQKEVNSGAAEIVNGASGSSLADELRDAGAPVPSKICLAREEDEIMMGDDDDEAMIEDDDEVIVDDSEAANEDVLTAPATSSDQQMASSEGDDAEVAPSQESEINVMEKEVTAISSDAAATSGDDTAMEDAKAADLVSIVDVHALSLVCRVLPETDD